MAIHRIVAVGRKNRRRDHRVTIPPIALTVNNRVYTTRDWSLGGFRVAPYGGGGLPGLVISVGISVTVGTDVYRHEAEAEIVRINPHDRTLAAHFTTIDSGAIATLEGLLTGRLRRTRGTIRKRRLWSIKRALGGS